MVFNITCNDKKCTSKIKKGTTIKKSDLTSSRIVPFQNIETSSIINFHPFYKQLLLHDKNDKHTLLSILYWLHNSKNIQAEL